MDAIIKKISYHQKEIYKLEKKLNKLKEKLKWKNYDENQIKVIRDDSDVILVEAFPGSGKTHTLLGRVKRIVDENPLLLTKIIIITFTKKAGEELREKIKSLVPGGEPYFVGTFHGLAYRELSSLLDKGLSLLDPHDEKSLIVEIGVNMVKKGLLNNNLIPIITKYIDMAYQVSSTQYPPDLTSFCDKNGLVEYKNDFSIILEKYRDEKDRLDLIDFNDLMTQFYLKLINNKLSKLENIDYLFFDEYQDVNPIQNQILKELNNRGIHLMVVGDPRQSIYSFRGSKVDFINNFELEFPNASKFILSYNYRSSLEIVKLCNDIFKPNCQMIPKKKSYRKPFIKVFTDFKLERKWVIDSIQEKYDQGSKYKNMTILTRKNKILSNLEADLIRRKIPYLKNGGVALLDRAHIKDLLSFMTVLYHPLQKFHWKRIFMLHNNIGIKKTNKILDDCDNLPDDLEKYQYDKSFESLFYLKQFIDKLSNFNLKETSIEIINYFNEIQINYNYSNDERENDYLAISQFLDNETSFNSFLEEIYLERTLSVPNNEDYLEINTFHGSKGLEWDTVYLMGLNGSEIPHFHSAFFLDENNSIEEERRLFFVACSRAKNELFLTSSLSAPWKNNDVVSPFVLELDNTLYQGKLLSINRLPSKDITTLVQSYLYSKGNLDIGNLLNKIKFTRINITKKFNLPTYLQSHYLPFIVGSFFDKMVTRMVYDDINVDNKKWDNIEKYGLHQDFSIDWKKNIKHFWFSSNGTNDNIWYDYLKNIDTNILENFSKDFNKFITKENVNDLEIYQKINYKGIYGEMDINTNKFIIEIKTCTGEFLTLKHLLQVILYYFVNKSTNKDTVYAKNKRILLYNPLSGEGIWLTKTTEWNDIAKKIIAFYCGE